MGAWARGSLLNLGARLSAVALGLLLTLYTARLGTAAQGAFALFLAVESVLLALGSGFGVALARRVSHHGERPLALVGVVVVLCLVLGAVTGLVLWVVAGAKAGAYAGLLWLALAAPLMYLPGNLSGLWLGQGRMVPLSALLLAPPALTLLGIAAASLAGLVPSLVVVLASWALARVVVSAATAAACWRSGWVARPTRSAFHEAAQRDARFVVVIGATNLISLLNYKVGLFLVERGLGLEATGIYSIAVAVAELLWLVSSALTTAAYAGIGQADRRASAALAVRAMRSSVGLLLVLCPVLWLAAVWLVPALLGEAYRPAVDALAWLLPGVALYGAASALSAWFTNHAGRPHVPALLALTSLLLTAVLTTLALPRWGLAGAAAATSLAYAVAMALGWVLFRRALRAGESDPHPRP
jgi:O-antigen/teichoic acid export membrane protein